MKDLYVWLVRIMSSLFYVRPKKNIYYLMSFDNNLSFIKQVNANLPKGEQLVVLYEAGNEVAATDLAAFGIKVVLFKETSLKFILEVIPKLMSARLIFCDNYYAFLAGFVRSKKKMKIIQVWHADGAIKCFGWEDPATFDRSRSAKKRFQRVYNQFDNFVVASKAMGEVFDSSYHEPMSKMKYLGYPRSDRFFNERWRAIAKRRIYQAAPELKGKRVILYAPTYREGVKFQPPEQVGKALTADPNAITVVKLHPLLQDQEAKIKAFSNDNIRFYDKLSTTDLLAVADTLVTDYSSVAFDFSLMPQAKSMLFFMFDLKEYEQNPGIQKDFLKWLPTAPLTTVDELSKAIVANKQTDFTNFNQHWNTYNDGHSTQRVIDKYVKNHN